MGKATSEGDLSDTTSTKEADEKYLKDLTATCEMKATDFESRQQLRAEEIAAIEKAIEILSSGDVAGNAAKYLPSMLQAKHGNGNRNAFAQLRADAGAKSQVRAAEYLLLQAKRLNSNMLSALAVRARDDPF